MSATAATSQQPHNCCSGGASCLWTWTDRGPGPRGQGQKAKQPAPSRGGGRPCPCPGDAGCSAVWAPLLWYPMCVLSHSVVSDSLGPCGLEPARLPCPWDSPGNNTGAGCHFLLQGIFLTQGSNLCLLCLQQQQVDF